MARLPTITRADRSTQHLENVKLYDPDAMLYCDVGLNWTNLPIEDRWKERMAFSHMPRDKSRFSCNAHDDSPQPVQWGGTGICIMNELFSRVHGKMGSDPENLGRWTWARIQRRENEWLRVAAAYRPVKNTAETGSSYQQQLRHFRNQGDYRCPIKIFDEQFLHQLQDWLSQGDHIIVGLDANADVRSGPVKHLFNEAGMHECVLKINKPDYILYNFVLRAIQSCTRTEDDLDK